MESITIPASSNTPTASTSAPAEGKITQEGSTTRIQVDASQAPAKPETKPTDRPAWLPEKFKTPEELAQSYSELEKKLGQGQKPETPATTPATTPEIKAETPKELPEVDMGKLTEEFSKNGKLSEDTYKSLAGKGFSKEVVDAHIAGQQALVEKYTNTLAESVGGKESLDSIVKWAGANLDDKTIDGVNAILKSGNETTAKMILASLKAQYVAAVGSDPSLVKGASAPNTSGIQPFRSNAEVTAAMSDKRYKTDAAYRQDVANRLAVTK